MRIILVRHGQTAWNVANRAQGHSDEPLDALGERQIAALAEALSGERIRRIVSSDLSRARKTAETVAAKHGLEVELDPRLRERSFGEWEGRAFEAIRKDVDDRVEAGHHPLEVCPPGGESVRDVWHRLAPVIESLRRERRPILVSTHGMAKSILLAGLLGADESVARAFRFGNTAISVVGLHGSNRVVLERYNDTRHLEGLE